MSDITFERSGHQQVHALLARMNSAFQANVDRGLSASTLSRDIVDLAFMIEGWSRQDADAGMAMAKMAYGGSVLHSLAAATRKMREDKIYRSTCVEGLAISEPQILSAGIKALGR